MFLNGEKKLLSMIVSKFFLIEGTAYFQRLVEKSSKLKAFEDVTKGTRKIWVESAHGNSE